MDKIDNQKQANLKELSEVFSRMQKEQEKYKKEIKTRFEEAKKAQDEQSSNL